MQYRRSGEGGSNSPIDLSKIKWTMSTTNFWAIIAVIIGGMASYYDLKTDNRVRDTIVNANGVRIITSETKLAVIDAKLTETRELMLKVSGQLDGISNEQHRVSRALERNNTRD